jgi:gliding motility-associated lipoprotein GldD
MHHIQWLIDFMKKKVLLFSILFSILFFSCNSTFTAKPKGYFNISFPKKEYQTFNQDGYPYSFEYPVYAQVVKDSSFFGESPENPFWININFPQFNGKIYISYNIIGGKAIYKIKNAAGKYIDSISSNTIDKLINGSYTLTYRHSSKAISIEDSIFTTNNNISGTAFKVGGDAATANQFFLTDSTKHFLRGALYFDATPNADSLLPVNAFLKEDMKHLINTFRWKTN